MKALGRCLTATVSLVLLCAAVAGLARRSTSAMTGEDAKAVAISFAKSIGLDVDGRSVKVFDNHKAGFKAAASRWNVSFASPDGEHYTLYVRDADPPYVGMLDNANRGYDRFRGKNRTGARTLATENDARRKAAWVADRVRGTDAVVLDEFRYSSEAPGRPGHVFARYHGVYKGHRFVDRFVGVQMEIDPQDGVIYSMRLNWVHPAVGSSDHKLGAAEARAIWRKRNAGVSGKTVASLDVDLGYALAPGDDTARLVWLVREKRRMTFIDANTGRVIRTRT